MTDRVDGPGSIELDSETTVSLDRETTPDNSPAADADNGSPDEPDDDPPGNEDDAETADVLRARIAVLEAEVERLREEYTRARRSQYHRAAIAMAVLGGVALVGAALASEQRTVLLALGGTGLFGAVLTYYLTPEQFVPATVGERIHEAHITNLAALIDELGLQDERVYFPSPDGYTPARLFIPQRANFDLPEDSETLLSIPDAPGGRGIVLEPTGGPLYEEFVESVPGEPADSPATLATQLADAVVETFELARSVEIEPDRDGNGVAAAVDTPVYGSLIDPDHPIVSVLATGLAVGLERPVRVTVHEADDVDGIVVFRWSEPEDSESG